ncbi:hypothetical protein KCP71_22925 [Salmonella enterica subsp. enterica]|nr:hypothetical protein KCP71_22925 [Salmonella enterica subsp. enterica]
MPSASFERQLLRAFFSRWIKQTPRWKPDPELLKLVKEALSCHHAMLLYGPRRAFLAITLIK